jgi:hypothetical protein
MTIKMNRVRCRWSRRMYVVAAGAATLGFIAPAVGVLAPSTGTPAAASTRAHLHGSSICGVEAAGHSGATGEPGTPATGQTGATGATGTPAASTLTGRITKIDVSAMSSACGAPVGISSASGSFDSVDTLSPAVSVTPSNLSVQLISSVDSTTVVGLVWEGGSFTCSVRAGNNECTNKSSGPSIPDFVHMAVEVTPSAPPGYTGDVIFGYQLSG